jgi:hypothetical protein
MSILFILVNFLDSRLSPPQGLLRSRDHRVAPE